MYKINVLFLSFNIHEGEHRDLSLRKENSLIMQFPVWKWVNEDLAAVTH